MLPDQEGCTEDMLVNCSCENDSLSSFRGTSKNPSYGYDSSEVMC